MSYTALYRKFRPQEFSEVKGQEHIVTTLQNQIINDRIGHAYLFTGTRGTGKTTVAKVFAKAVNCENVTDGSPCNECSVCSSINNGSSVDVVELDAASNNSVEDIRQIVEEVGYPPTQGRYKVYIIDEVHMLSTAAFNALLKTLEEPPSYVIFILATTEVHKIPITILSRCQRYDFRRITIDTIASRLEELINKEGIDIEEKAVKYIAKVADGSMRDALSLLDQCVAFYMGESITYDNVLKCLGAVDTEIFSRLLRNVIEKNVVGAIDIIEEVVSDGREIGQFVLDFTWYLRNLILIKSSDDMEDVLDISTDNMKLIKQEALIVSDDEAMRYIRILSELSSQIRYSSQKRVLVEIAIIKLCKPAMETDNESLIQRLNDLEVEVASGVVVSNSIIEGSRDTSNVVQKSNFDLPIEEDVEFSRDIQDVIDNWNEIINEIDGSFIKIAFKKAKGAVVKDVNGVLTFVASETGPDDDMRMLCKSIASESEGYDPVKDIQNAIYKVTGKHVEIQTKIYNEVEELKGSKKIDFKSKFKTKGLSDNIKFDNIEVE